jgi:hypothetical protein
MAVKRKSYKKIRKGGKKSMRRKSKMRKRGGGMAPMNPSVFPTPLPEANPGLDAAFALAQDPLNRALMSGGKRRKSRKCKRGGRGMAPMNPAVFPTPLPESNPGLDAAFALAELPLNRTLSGGKKKLTKRGRKGKKSRGGNKLMEKQAFIEGQANPLFRTLSHSGGSPAPIPPNRDQPVDSNNWWVGENGQTFFAPTREDAFRQSMALGNEPATKSMEQNRWIPFTR